MSVFKHVKIHDVRAIRALLLHNKRQKRTKQATNVMAACFYSVVKPDFVTPYVRKVNIPISGGQLKRKGNQ